VETSLMSFLFNYDAVHDYFVGQHGMHPLQLRYGHAALCYVNRCASFM
jgi:hypothetical protein